ncbi:SDR family oxidoreductase [Actinomadura sediminis]|uniref:SDR family oxidoreductase n=1 Tax=Actinomadura sediminis TaxID=1038904 RepID=A0ABW3EJ11_9ACTN
MNGLLRDKVVVVSGAGPGLGRATAVRCAAAGADVVLAARDAGRLAAIAAEVEALGRRALAVPTDITDAAAAEALAGRAVDAFGHVDALVNNAAAPTPPADLMSLEADSVTAGLAVDVVAPLRLTQLFADRLAERGGSVVMVASSVIRESPRSLGVYKMAKTALTTLTQALSSELGPRGVRVNTIAPGLIWADAVKTHFAHAARERGVPVQRVYDETAAGIDRRRLQEPEEVADAIVFLLSDLARAVTGHCLDVNGGQYHN